MSSDAADGAFTWHPDYAGRSYDDVRRELADSIGRDQRAYDLALSGAERDEHATLTSVRDIERRWSQYSLDWAETDPQVLADRVLAFQQERDRQQRMIPWDEYREAATPVARTARATAPGPAATSGQPISPLLWVAPVLLLLIAIVILWITVLN